MNKIQKKRYNTKLFYILWAIEQLMPTQQTFLEKNCIFAYNIWFLAKEN